MPPYLAWKIRFTRHGMWWLIHHDDQFLGKCFKHTDGYWVVHVEGHARTVRGFASRSTCADYVLDWWNGPDEPGTGDKSHMEYSRDGLSWSSTKMNGCRYLRWVTIGLVVEHQIT